MSGYLKTFFEEKDLPFQQWEIRAPSGTMHIISNEVVIEAILGTSGSERETLKWALRSIDFHNGDVNAYLRQLAVGLVTTFEEA